MRFRPLLKSSQWAELTGIPVDEDNLIRHYTLSGDDIDRVLAKRGHHNQLGFAIQLCLMRHPSRLLMSDETPPSALLSFVAAQVGVDPAVFADYAQRDNTRREHAAELQSLLGLRTATHADLRQMLSDAATAAAATDQGMPIANAMVQSCCERAVLLPSTGKMDRIGRAGRVIARRKMELALLEGMGDDRSQAIDDLLVVDPVLRQSHFGWLRARPEAPGTDNLIGLLNRLAFVRALGIDAGRRDKVHPDRWRQLVREGAVTPSWLAADFNTGRRRATIVAQMITLAETLTDEAVTMFNKLIGRLFSNAVARRQRRHADTRQETAQALRLFRDTLRALSEANESDSDLFETLDTQVGWYRLLQAKPLVEAMVVDADPDPLMIAAERYTTVRKYAPRFLETFTFGASRRNDPMLAALDLIRRMNRERRRSLPDKVPVGHLKPKTRKLIFAEDNPSRRLYEVATLAALRDRLRSGDVWVEGSHAFRPFDEHLMPRPSFEKKRAENALGLAVPQNADAWLNEMRQTLDFRMKQLSHRARSGRLEGVRYVDGQLVASPLSSDVPAMADSLKWEMNDLLPRVHITGLLAEVHGWTTFADRFTHLRTQEMVRSRPAILSAILADATNLGPRRMAEASADVSERQIAWARLFHIRPETYKAAQVVIANAHARHPHARLWGTGTTSSSDGQFFRASDRAARRSDVNRHYGSDPGTKFYSHLSDQYGYYSILPISPSESEAPYVLDGIFDHETSLDIGEHYTDTGGASDHVFGLFALLGRRFAPRLRNLKDRRFHTLDRPDTYPTLKRHIGAPINTALIREHWDDLLHLAASLNERVVAPSAILRKLAASPRPGALARALREVGRIERTLFMIEWYSNPALRRRCQAGLNKGEAAHKLKRAVFFHERGEIRDRSFDSQAYRASGLNLVVSAIVHWNTVYLARAAQHLRAQNRDIPDSLLRHVSPLTWEHINLTGTYSWTTKLPEPGELRPVRQAGASFDWAA